MTTPTEPRRIGLMGGTFDPVHHGHLIMAEWLASALRIPTTWFIPNRIHPLSKRAHITEARHRLAMLSRAVAPFPGFRISEFELKRNAVSHTVDTLEHFKQQWPDSELYLFMGSDNLNQFLEWHEPFKILELARLAVYTRRTDSDPPEELKNHPRILLVNSPVIDISSSHIRHRIAENLPFRSLVPQRVFEYITSQRLYVS
ncbi:MAG: nicotinate (nicotinamide) nucleotide adenylyltransferase [Calditrichaeota bacterium]|nr:MAG: nicotinate (nicotinamide) nucleotide adenylyltransferase [Calditrichota bacterium]